MNPVLKEDIDRFRSLLDAAELVLKNQQTYLVRHKNPLIDSYLQLEQVFRDLEEQQ